MDLALQAGEVAGSPFTPPDPLARARVALVYWWRHGRLPQVAHPRRFTEWVQWRKLHDRDLGLARLTDKTHAKALAASLLGPDPIIPTLWRGTVLPPQPPAPLPLVVKANHGCNQYRVVRTLADWQAVRALAPRWMATTYGGWLDEWHYGAACKGLIIETFVSPDGELPRDYKVYVFGGVARMVQVHLDRARNHRWMQFDRDWQLLSRPADDLPPPPATLERMLRAAEAIAGMRDFLRVDFYEIDGRMLFGEACLFPGSGLDPFDSDELDLILGQLWAGERLNPADLSPPAPNRLAPGTTG